MRKPVWSWSSLFRRLGFNVSRRKTGKTPRHHKSRVMAFEPLEPKQMLSMTDLSGLTCAVLDNQDAAYAEIGSGWASYSEQGAYLNDFRYHAASNQADAAAVWTVNNLSTEQDALYQVFATWHEAGNRTNAQFTVLDGDTAIKTTTLNQTFAPNDANLNSQNWKSIGVVHSDTGTLKVELSDLAQNGYVIADAICIARLPQTTTLTTLVDDGDANYVESGAGWLGWNENAYNGDIRYHAVGTDGAAATWDFDNLDTSLSYRVLVTWSPSFNRAQDSPFSVLDGSQVVDTTRLNQQYAADEVQIDGRGWESLGVFQASSGSLSVQLGTNASSGYVIADAVQLVSVTPPATTPTIIDDGDINFIEHGDSWRGWSESGAFGGDFRYAPGGTGDNYADWQFAGLAAGTYNIYVTWHEASNRATNSLFSVMQGETVLASTRLNQQNAPSGVTASGQVWQSIGQVTISDGNITVRLSDSDANGFIIADAARIELVNLAPKIGNLQGGPNPNVAGSVLNLRAADVEDDDGEVAAVRYYLDIDGDGALDANVDELLGTDDDGSDGWSWAGPMPAASSGSISQTYFAQAVDDQGLTSNVASLSVSAGVYAILDDSMPGYAETGMGWTDVLSESDFLGTSRRHDGASSTTGDGTAIWTYENIPVRNYDVQVTWQADENLASNALFEIYDGATLIATRRVDQTTGPSDVNADGAWWKSLGTFRLTSGTAVVKLISADADAPVAADAVRLFDPPVVTIEDSCCYLGQSYACLVISATDFYEEFTVSWQMAVCYDQEIVGENYEHRAETVDCSGGSGEVTFTPVYGKYEYHHIIYIPVCYRGDPSDYRIFEVNFSGGGCSGGAHVTINEGPGQDIYIDGPSLSMLGNAYSLTNESWWSFNDFEGENSDGENAIVFWGDGSPSAISHVLDVFPSHTYTSSGIHPVYAVATDGHYTYTSNIISVGVGDNAAINGPGTSSTAEDYVLNLGKTNATSPANWWKINWGDSQDWQIIEGDPEFVGHQYAEAGEYTITAQVWRNNIYQTQANSLTVNVADGSAHWVEGPSVVAAGVQYNWYFYGNNTNYCMLWGDGTLAGSNNHTYQQTGDYEITISESYTQDQSGHYLPDGDIYYSQPVSVEENAVTAEQYGYYGSYGFYVKLGYAIEDDLTLAWSTSGLSAQVGTDYRLGTDQTIDANGYIYDTYTYGDNDFTCTGCYDSELGEYSGVIIINAGHTMGAIPFVINANQDKAYDRYFRIDYSLDEFSSGGGVMHLVNGSAAFSTADAKAFDDDGYLNIPVYRNSSLSCSPQLIVQNNSAVYGTHFTLAEGQCAQFEGYDGNGNAVFSVDFNTDEYEKYVSFYISPAIDQVRNFYYNVINSGLSFSSPSHTAEIHPGYCFAAGTKVLMANGSSKNIEDIQTGEMVLCVDENTPEGPVEAKPVVETYHNSPHRLIEIHIGEDVIRCTLKHPFYVKDKGWTSASDLAGGDILRTASNKWIAVTKTYLTDVSEPVYNIHTADFHTYFIGDYKCDCYILVHNSSTPAEPNGLTDMVQHIDYSKAPVNLPFSYDMDVKWTFDKSSIGKIFIQVNKTVYQLIENKNVRVQLTTIDVDMHKIEPSDLTWNDKRGSLIPNAALIRALLYAAPSGCLSSMLCSFKVTESAYSYITNQKDINVQLRSDPSGPQVPYDPTQHNKETFDDGQTWIPSETCIRYSKFEYDIGSGLGKGENTLFSYNNGWLIGISNFGKMDYCTTLDWSTQGSIVNQTQIMEIFSAIEWNSPYDRARKYLQRLNTPAIQNNTYIVPNLWDE
jgi:hypothetical protein